MHCSWDISIYSTVFHKNSLYKILGANRANYGEKIRIPLAGNIADTVACQNQRSGILYHKGGTFVAAHSEKISCNINCQQLFKSSNKTFLG